MPALFDLRGRVAIITGGNGGIGKGIALAMAEAGADVVVAARDEAKTAQAVKDIQATGARALGLRVDVTSADDARRMTEETLRAFGRVDVLVNNAGVNRRANPEDLAVEDWELVLGTNLTAAFLCSRAVFPAMKAQGGGKIINIGSMTSLFGMGISVAYSSSKGGVIQLSKSLANAWARHNIQVNALLPGWIVTDMTNAFKEFNPAQYDFVTRRIPAARWGQPSDVGGPAVFLASRASDYVTGAVLTVDGGYSSY